MRSFLDLPKVYGKKKTMKPKKKVVVKKKTIRKKSY